MKQQTIKKTLKRFQHNHQAVSNVLGYLLTIGIVFSLFVSTMFLTTQTLDNKSYAIIDIEAESVLNQIADSIVQAIELQQNNPDLGYTIELEIPTRLGGVDDFRSFGGRSYQIDITQEQIYLNVSNGISKTKQTYLTNEMPIKINPTTISSDEVKINIQIQPPDPLIQIDFNSGNATTHSPHTQNHYFIGDTSLQDPWSNYASASTHRNIVAINNTDINSIDLDNQSQVCIPLVLNPDTVDYTQLIYQQEDETTTTTRPYIGYNYQKTITLDPDQIKGTLQNFPILLNIQSDSELASHVEHEDGRDLLFTDQNYQQLYHEIEYFDKTTGTLICWVNVSTLSPTQNTLHLYYGKDNIAYENQPQNTWNSEFESIWHYKAEGDKALYFNGQDNYIDLGQLDYLDENDMSIEFLFTKSPDQSGCLFSEENGFSVILEAPDSPLTYSTSTSNWKSMLVDPADHFNFRYQGTSKASQRWGYVGINDGQQHHVVLTVDGDYSRLYIDSDSLGQKSLRSGEVLSKEIVAPLQLKDNFLFFKKTDLFEVFNLDTGIDTAQWNFTSSYQYDTPFCFTDNITVIKNDNRYISFLNTTTGTPILNRVRPYNNDITTILTNNDTVVLTYDGNNRIYVYKDDGTLIRSNINNGGTPNYPTLDDNALYVTKGTDRLMAYDLSDGSKLWGERYLYDENSEPCTISSEVQVNDSSLYVIGEKGSTDYLFNLSTYVDKIQASDKEKNDYFGRSVALHGEYAVVGAYQEDSGGSNAGAAYVFFKNSTTGMYQEVNKIMASDAQSNDYFGYSTDIYGEYVVVGAYQEDSGGSNAGAAYIFKKNSVTGQFEELQKIQASNRGGYDYFGRSVALYGDYVVVGAYQEDSGGSNAGVAYIFKRNSTTGLYEETQKILASDSQNNDRFGLSVDIYGEYVVVGAYQEDSGGSNAGAAYVFKKNSGSGLFEEVNKLVASDTQADDYFGRSVAVHGEYVVVGAYQEDSGGSNAGAAYVFKKNSGSGLFEEVNKLVASDAQADDRFGFSVDISSEYVVVGAYREDTGGTNAGSAIVFVKNSTTGSFEELNKIQASDLGSYDYFGIEVSILEDTVLIGSYQEDTGERNCGAAYFSKAITQTRYKLPSQYQKDFFYNNEQIYYMDEDNHLVRYHIKTKTSQIYAEEIEQFYLENATIYLQTTSNTIKKIQSSDFTELWTHSPPYLADYFLLIDEKLVYGSSTQITILTKNNVIQTTYTTGDTIFYEPLLYNTCGYYLNLSGLIELDITTNPAVINNTHLFSSIKTYNSAVGRNLFEPTTNIYKNYFKGFLDRIRIYSTVLDHTQIDEMYQGSRLISNLEAEYMPIASNINGNTLYDSSGNSRHATLYGDLLIYSSIQDSTKNDHDLLNYGSVNTNGKINESFELLSSDHLLSTDFDLDEYEWTIEGWVYPTASGGTILSKGDEFRIYYSSSYNLAFNAALESTTINLDIGTTPQNQWSYYAVTRVNNKILTYLNGDYVDEETLPDDADFSNQNSWIVGAYQEGSTDYVDAKMDEMRLSQTRLSSNWITTTYNTINNQTGSTPFATITNEGNITGATSPASQITTNLYLIDPTTDQPLPFYITQWNPNGNTILYVNSSTLQLDADQSTNLYLYYGGANTHISSLDDISTFNENFQELTELWELSYIPPEQHQSPLPIPQNNYLISSTAPIDLDTTPCSYLLQTRFNLQYQNSSYTTLLSESSSDYDDAILLTASQQADYLSQQLLEIIEDGSSIQLNQTDTNSYTDWIQQHTTLTLQGTTLSIQTSYLDETHYQPYRNLLQTTTTLDTTDYHLGLACDIDALDHNSQSSVDWIRLIKTTPLYTPILQIGVTETQNYYWENASTAYSYEPSYLYVDSGLQDGMTVPSTGNTFIIEGLTEGVYYISINQGSQQPHQSATLTLQHQDPAAESIQALLARTEANHHSTTVIPITIDSSGYPLHLHIQPNLESGYIDPLINTLRIYRSNPNLTLTGGQIS